MSTSMSIRAKVDKELTNRVGKWFTVRQIQDKLRINPSTLKPLIMKYAREKVLVRRKVKGTARSVEFSPAANSINTFKAVLVRHMPYRNFGGSEVLYSTAAKGKSSATKSKKSSTKRSTKSSAKRRR